MTTPTTTSGRIVNQGTPPPHQCSTIAAPGRPSAYNVNPGTVWQCACGKFYKMKTIRVVDYEGDDAGTENRWFRVKNAAGDEYQRIEVDPTTYLTPKILGATCTQHGRVLKSHRHHTWA